MIKIGYKKDNYWTLKLIEIKNNDECWFQCLYSYSVFFKTPKQILYNQFILERLHSLDACIVGVTCGEVYRFHINNNISFGTELCKEAKNNYSQYKILCVYRNKIIEYENEEKKIKAKNILELAQDIDLISKFSSKDAFYVGFLFGLELNKYSNKQAVKNKLLLIYSNSQIMRHFYMR